MNSLSETAMAAILLFSINIGDVCIKRELMHFAQSENFLKLSENIVMGAVKSI